MNRYKYKEDAKGIIINIKHGALKEGRDGEALSILKAVTSTAPGVAARKAYP